MNVEFELIWWPKEASLCFCRHEDDFWRENRGYYGVL